jgi:3-oxosteroid 1-dehydrogenase
MSCPHAILVDQAGRRFANEAGSYMEIGQRQHRRHAETGQAIPAWAILDQRHRDRYLWGPVLGRTPQKWLDSGYMIKADTIGELAARCGIDGDGLRAELDRFNGFCRTGHDDDFGRGNQAFDRSHGDPTVRPNPNLGTIEQGPFYAVRIVPGDVGTIGGLVTDPDALVQRADGTPIHGLYAIGNTAASVFGEGYPGGGTSIGSSFIFGYRAVEAMA